MNNYYKDSQIKISNGHSQSVAPKRIITGGYYNSELNRETNNSIAETHNPSFLNTQVYYQQPVSSYDKYRTNSNERQNQKYNSNQIALVSYKLKPYISKSNLNYYMLYKKTGKADYPKANNYLTISQNYKQAIHKGRINKYLQNQTLNSESMINSFLNDSFKSSLEQYKQEFLRSPSSTKKHSMINIVDNRSGSKSNNRSNSKQKFRSKLPNLTKNTSEKEILEDTIPMVKTSSTKHREEMTVNKMVKQNGKLTDLSKRHKSVKVTHKQISNPHSKATLKNRFKIRQNHGSLPRTNELSRDQKLLVGYNLKRNAARQGIRRIKVNQNVSPNKIRLRNKVNTGNDRNTTIEEGKVDHFHEEQQSQQVVHQIEHPGLVKKNNLIKDQKYNKNILRNLKKRNGHSTENSKYSDGFFEMQISSSPYKNVVPNSKQNYDSFPELEQQAPNHRSSRKFEKLSDRDHSSKKSTARKQEFSKKNSSLKQAQMINTDHFNSQDIKIIRPDDKTPKIEEEKNHKVVQDSHIFQAKQVIHTFGIQPEEGEPLKSPQFNEYEQEFDLEVTEVNNLRNGSKLDVFITDDHGSFNIDSDNNIRIPVNSQAPGTNDDSYYNSVNTSSGKIAFIEGNQVINPESSYSLSKNMSNKQAFNGRADSLLTASDKIDTLNVHRENKIQNSSQYDAFNNAGAIENVEDVHQPLNIVVNEKADPKKSVSEFDFNNDGEPDVPSDLQEDEDDAQFYDPVTGENTNRTPIYKFGNKILPAQENQNKMKNSFGLEMNIKNGSEDQISLDNEENNNKEETTQPVQPDDHKYQKI